MIALWPLSTPLKIYLILLRFPFPCKTDPHSCEFNSGVAAGASVPYASILALNVRTEIAYGMAKDGCTAIYRQAEKSTYLAQNWDWQEEQQENLIGLYIRNPPKPPIAMVTEAGIIGKIGLNGCGVGVCLNAIKALGVDFADCRVIWR